MKEILQKEYDFCLGLGALERLRDYISGKSYSAIFVLADTKTKKYCWPLLKPMIRGAKVLVIPEGESSKQLSQAEKVWSFLQRNEADRHALLINLGGGVVSDLGGFCASTYKRGIDFINVPTTLLAMVDAAIGGKQGIDLETMKNNIGVFKHPVLICVYPEFLKTLPENELMNGLAEIVKHALISNKPMFDYLSITHDFKWQKEEELIFYSVQSKMYIVSKDPYEKNIRKTLNFGHTIGHAIESWSMQNDVRPLKHGEAIAIGMICEAWLSREFLGLSESALNSITEYFTNRFPKYYNLPQSSKLINLMKNDKKNRNGEIRFALLQKIGKAKVDIPVDEENISRSIKYYKGLKP